MSSCPPNTGAPSGVHVRHRAPTSDSIRSRSWIIRSSTAPMSVDRPVNGPCRSASIELRADRPADQFLERRVEPLDVPDLERHARVRRRARPVRRPGPAVVRDRLLDQDRDAAFEERPGDRVVVEGRGGDADRVDLVEQVVRGDVEGVGAEHGRRSTSAWCGLASATPTSSTSGRPARMRAWCLPRCPTPTTAIRMRFMRHCSPSAGVPTRVRQPPGGPDSRWATRRQGAGQFHVQGVARPVGDHVADQVEAAQGQVADQIEDLVAGRLVRET